jgi:hypothetical protein
MHGLGGKSIGERLPENMVRGCFIFNDRGVFFTEKVNQIIAIMDSRVSN